MSEFNKYSTDGGATFLDVEDSNAVHYGEQAKGYVGKNLLKNNASTTTISGVSFTVNSDGSITLNGTATANITSFFVNSNMALKAGSYWLTGNPSGITGTSYGLKIANTSYSVNTFFEQGKILTLNQDYSDLRIDIRIPNGQVIDNLTFYPMIRLATISDSTYEPYLTPNTEIDNKVSYTDNTILGAKNFWFWRIASQERNGITYTQNDDGTVGINGTATAQADLYSGKFKFKNKGQYIITGCPSGGSTESNTNYGIGIYDYSVGRWFWDYGFGVRFEVTDIDTEYMFSYVVRNGKSVSNLTLKPLLRLASDTNDTYVPYAMTNRELTENIKTIDITSSLSAQQGTLDSVGNYVGKKGDMINFVMRITGITANDQTEIARINGVNLKISELNTIGKILGGNITGFRMTNGTDHIKIYCINGLSNQGVAIYNTTLFVNEV